MFTSRARGVRRVLVVLAIPVLLLTVRPLSAHADGGLQTVLVRRTPQGVTAVVRLEPAPLAPLVEAAAVVTPVQAAPGAPPGAGGVAATVSPVVDLTAGTPLALVVDASAAGAQAQAQGQTLSASAGLLRRLPTQAPVAVVADASPPRLLTRDGARPADAITALTHLSTSPGGATGVASAAAALALAVRHLPRSAGGVRVVVLTTSGAPPAGHDALADRLATEGVVLGVVVSGSSVGSWQDVSARTGGTAVAAVPSDPSSAYDSLLAALQGRYVVRFPPPAGARQVVLAVTSGGRSLTTVLTIPGAAGAASAPAAPRPATAVGDSPAVPLAIPAGLLGLAGLVLLTAMLLGRRRRASGRSVVPAPERTADAEAAQQADPRDVGAPELPAARVFRVHEPERPAPIPPRAAAPESEPVTLAPAPDRPEPASAVRPPPLPAAPAPAPLQAAPSARVTPSTPPEPSRPAPAAPEYVGRHRGAGPADGDDEVDVDTDVVHSAPARRPGAHREGVHRAGSLSEVG